MALSIPSQGLCFCEPMKVEPQAVFRESHAVA